MFLMLTMVKARISLDSFSGQQAEAIIFQAVEGPKTGEVGHVENPLFMPGPLYSTISISVSIM